MQVVDCYTDCLRISAQHRDDDYTVFHLILNDYSYTSDLC